MMGNKRICVIGNIGAHYRLPIYTAMNKEFACDFYFGDHMQTPIKAIEKSSLAGYKATLKNIFFYKFYWQRKSIGLLNKPYEYYILDGEPYCISSWVILLLSKLKKKKTIAWTHGWYGRENLMKRIIKRCFYSLFSKLMVYSEYSITLMKKEGFKSNNLFCIANSLDSDKEENIRKKMKPTNLYIEHFHNVNPTIIYCGRIQKIKKLELILESMDLLKSQGYLINAVFVGKDIENLKLENLAQKLDLNNQVWFFGPCYNDIVLGELFYNANLCVSPGNVGLTAILSLSFGCPVITQNNFAWQMPEFESIKPNKTGDFFEQNNIYDLADKIRKWTSLTLERRLKIRQYAYQEIGNKWNTHHQIEVIKKVISS
jgi:glycosyltransferase involved in cell wall biosynthesis